MDMVTGYRSEENECRARKWEDLLRFISVGGLEKQLKGPLKRKASHL